MEVVAQPQGRGVVVLGVEADQEQVAVVVEDNGSGIPPDILSHIFEPFFSTKEKGGHGIGLAVAYGIARRHGGDIEVSSTPERGSTFRLCLARNPRVPDEESSPSPPGIMEEGAR
jgi:two-component system NtrC family sensor kinase